MANAVRCYERGNLGCAIAHLERARARDPTDAQIWFMLGNAYYRKGEWDGAIASYREAARLRPGHPDTYLNLGFSYYQRRRHPEAAQAWETAVRSSRADPMARMAFAVGLASLGREEDALDELRYALRVRGDSCESARLRIDIRWAGEALAQMERLCAVAGRPSK